VQYRVPYSGSYSLGDMIKLYEGCNAYRSKQDNGRSLMFLFVSILVFIYI
jgi:hypothetical protein